MSLIGIYSIKVDYHSCEKFEFNLFQNKIICERVQGTETDSQGNVLKQGVYTRNALSITELYLFPFVIISTFITGLAFYFYFFRFSHFSPINHLIANFYNNICGKDIRKESFFLGTFLFTYMFILIGLMLSLNRLKLISAWVDALAYSLSVAVPITVSIYFCKKWLNSPTPKKAFFKSPLSTIFPSLLFVILIEVYLQLYASINHLTGESGLIGLGWLLLSPIYALGIFLISLLLTSYLYYYSKREKRTLLRLIMVLLLCIPYLSTFIGAMI